MNENKLSIDINDTLFYIVELNDDFDEDTLSPEERQQIEDHNTAFWNNSISPVLLEKVVPCGCSTNEFMQKHQRKSSLYPDPSKYIPQIDQDDVNAFTFSLTILSDNGKYIEVSSIMRSCNKCRKIDIWADLHIAAQTLAEITNTYLNNKELELLETEVEDTIESIDNDFYTENIEE